MARAKWIVIGCALVAQTTMGGERFATPANERWKAECGSCHVAYPPQLLPADGWRRVMAGLERHFGTDASLDAAASTEIGAFLEVHAASGRRASAAAGKLRITETAWFVREHDEVPPAAWKSAAVRSAANCAACHADAEQGGFRERNVRIPR
jgi:hypothetical protein